MVDSSMLSEKVHHSWVTPVCYQKRYTIRGISSMVSEQVGTMRDILQYGIRKGTLCVVDSSMVDPVDLSNRTQ